MDLWDLWSRPSYVFETNRSGAKTDVIEIVFAANQVGHAGMQECKTAVQVPGNAGLRERLYRPASVPFVCGMRRLVLFALAAGSLQACSFLGAGQPVLAVELAPAPGFVLDAAGLEDARAVIAKRLETASRNARVSIAGTSILVELDAKSAAEWPDMKSTILAPSALSFLPVATSTAPFMSELRIEVERAGIVALKDEWAASSSEAAWTFKSPDRDLPTLITDMDKLVATVTSSDPRWQVVIDQSGSQRDCRECVIVVDRGGGMDRVRVTSASAQSGEYGDASVRVTLSADDAKRFEAITGSMLKRKLAIVLDGVATSTPVVQEAIAGGNVQILMGRTKSPTASHREARALAAALSSGTLPAPLVVTAERTIGTR